MGRVCCPCLELAGDFVGQNVQVRSVGNTVEVGELQPIAPGDQVITLNGQNVRKICCDNIFSVQAIGGGATPTP